MMNKKFRILILICMISSGLAEAQSDIKQQLRSKFGFIAQNGLLGEKIYSSTDLQQFYLEREFETVWNQNLANELVLYIGNIRSQGLQPEDYHYLALKQVDFMDISRLADYDILLSDAFVLLASHLISGKVNPVTIDSDWKVIRREGKPVELLKKAIASNRVQSTLDELMPDYKAYSRLMKNLNSLKEDLNQPWTLVGPGETLKPGTTDVRVVDLRTRLNESGDLKPYAYADAEFYDSLLLQGVKFFQKRHGLTPDGNVGKNTLNELNISKPERVNQIILNLERSRWLPEKLGDHYIMVNIPAFELEVVKNGAVTLEMTTAVGKPLRKTPVFSQKMSYIVFNPYWTVPPTILINDMIPAQAKNPNHLKNLNMKVLTNAGVEVDPSSISWSTIKPKAFPYMLRQEPGANNALGVVKFIFPNTYNIYMHDTNHREIFVKEDRALSSGCIRLSRPLDLAAYLLIKNGKLTQTQLDDILKNKKDYSVILRENVQVHIQYWTSFVDENGILNFRKDVYGRDEPLLLALKAKSPPVNQN